MNNGHSKKGAHAFSMHILNCSKPAEGTQFFRECAHVYQVN